MIVQARVTERAGRMVRPDNLPSDGRRCLGLFSVVLGVLGILTCLGVLFWIPAIILGKRARADAQSSVGQPGEAGLGLGGIVLGYTSIVWSLIVILAAAPALKRAKQEALPVPAHRLSRAQVGSRSSPENERRFETL